VYQLKVTKLPTLAYLFSSHLKESTMTQIPYNIAAAACI